MAKLNSIAKMIKANKMNSVAESFINDLVYTIEQEDKSDDIPTKSFKPSGIGGCNRRLYYELTGVQPDIVPGDSNLVGICESGTYRHEEIQNYVMKMKEHNIDCEWLDVAQYLVDNNINDPVVIEQKGNETKLYSEKYNMRFMCDGLIKYNGELYILEIKTESTHKYNRHTEPFEDHKLQATCYAMTLGVDKVIFLYEDRDNCSKKGYLVEVTKKMKMNVSNKIDLINDFVSTKSIPNKCEDSKKCRYCDYKEVCRNDGQ